MFIHLGGDIVLKAERIITILDHQSEEASAENRAFMKRSRDAKQTVEVTGDPAKSIVVTDDCIYLSPISSHTLKRRAENKTIANTEEEESTRP
ncbi:extracellular matrix regulator RemB [Bacillus daqingensis]|uniref:Extracellular matrix regulator RemB n=1 Tax=Bacillus daqingensis TaxID=872396 RepID=A0ABV9NXB6_9BACI